MQYRQENHDQARIQGNLCSCAICPIIKVLENSVPRLRQRANYLLCVFEDVFDVVHDEIYVVLGGSHVAGHVAHCGARQPHLDVCEDDFHRALNSSSCFSVLKHWSSIPLQASETFCRVSHITLSTV